MPQPGRIPKRGKLKTIGNGPSIVVEFQFNPTQVTDRRAANYATLEAPGLILPVKQYGHGGDRTITFTVHVDAFENERVQRDASPPSHRIDLDDDGGITRELNKYLSFVYPVTSRLSDVRGSFLPVYASNQQFVAPPTCRLFLGASVVDCVVTEVSISQTMFNEQLAPIRADVSLTLVELSPYGDRSPDAGSS